jgi:hypothetical protein
MLAHLVFSLIVCYGVIAVPTGELNQNAVNQEQKIAQHELNDELISKIADFTDDKTNFMLGITSKTINAMTEERNKKNRLLQIRNHCGLKQYFQVTSNGHEFFTRSILDSPRNKNFYSGRTVYILFSQN